MYVKMGSPTNITDEWAVVDAMKHVSDYCVFILYCHKQYIFFNWLDVDRFFQLSIYESKSYAVNPLIHACH